MDVGTFKASLPSADRVAASLYNIVFNRNIARCPFTERHTNGDRNPSLRYDSRKERIFCASQHCFGDRGVDAIGLVEAMEGLEFTGATTDLQNTTD